MCEWDPYCSSDLGSGGCIGKTGWLKAILATWLYLPSDELPLPIWMAKGFIGSSLILINCKKKTFLFIKNIVESPLKSYILSIKVRIFLNNLGSFFFVCVLKFIYFEKATKFFKIFTLLLITVHTAKSKVNISQNFVVSQNIHMWGHK